MRDLRESILVFPWLLSLVLSQEHVHANYHGRRGLSDIIESALGPGYEGIASQVEGQLGVSAGQGGATPSIGVATTILAGPDGVNSAWFTDTPQPTSAIFVTTSIQGAVPGAEAAVQNSPGGEAVGYILVTIVTEGTSLVVVEQTSAALQTTVQLTSTLTVAPTPAAGNTNTIQETQQLVSTVAPSPAPLPASSVPPAAAPQPIPVSSPAAEVPQPVSISSPPPVATPSSLPPIETAKASPVASSVVTPGVGVPGAVAFGTGTLGANGQCDCKCICGVGSFPSPTPSLPVIISNGTTLQTVISSPTSSVSLPSSILVDTSSPPVPAGNAPPSSAAPAAESASSTPIDLVSTSNTTSTSSSAPTTSLSPAPSPSTSTTIPPAQSAETSSFSTSLITPTPQSTPTPPSSVTSSADSTIRFSLTATEVLPAPTVTAAPEIAGADASLSSIDIGKFTLASSLVLGPLGG